MASGRKVVLDYELCHKLGSGSFAKVYKGVHIVDGSVVAVKVVARDKLTEKLQQNLAHEIHILKHMRHPNVVALYTFQKRSSSICLILEYCDGGDLHRFIRDHPSRRLAEPVARHFLRHLAAGLRFLWGQNLIHRDIKPQNLLLSAKTEEATLKIADFGFARYIGPQAMAATLCGTPLYMAPEVLENKEYDTKADLWSVGCVYFEMLVGRPPFTGANHIELLKNIRTKRLQVPEEVTISSESVSVLRLLLNRSPATRGNLDQFLSHPVLAGASGAVAEGHITDPTSSFQQDLGMQVGVPRAPPLVPVRPAGATPPVPSEAKVVSAPAAVPAASPASAPPVPSPTVQAHREHKSIPQEPPLAPKAAPAEAPGPQGGSAVPPALRHEIGAYDPVPHVDISSQQSVHRSPRQSGPKVLSPYNSQQTSSNSDDFVVIETPEPVAAAAAAVAAAAESESRPKRFPSSLAPHPTGGSSTATVADSAEANVARVANGLPFVEVYAQFAFAVAGVGDARVIRFLGDTRDAQHSWFSDTSSPAADTPPRPSAAVAHRALLLHEALTLYKKALAMLKHCVGLVRKHLYGLSGSTPRSVSHSRAAVSEQQRAQGLLPWLLESMQNILERAEECNRRLKTMGLDPAQLATTRGPDRNSMESSGGSQDAGKCSAPPGEKSRGGSGANTMSQSVRVGRSAEEMIYEFASQLVQDGSAKEMLGQVQNAHAQLVRAQILLDALQLEGHAGMSENDAEQLRAYSHRLRQKVEGLEKQHPVLPPSGSLIRRLVA